MATENPYGVKAVSDHDAGLMRAYTPPCIELIRGCQDEPEVSYGAPRAHAASPASHCLRQPSAYTRLAPLPSPPNPEALRESLCSVRRTSREVTVRPRMFAARRFVGQVCDEAQTFCDEHITLPYYLSGLNPYDVR